MFDTIIFFALPHYYMHFIFLGYNSDIICLQEVDRKIFNSCLNPILGSEGLDGVFFKKGKEVAEGLACFYRKDRFRYVIIIIWHMYMNVSCILD